MSETSTMDDTAPCILYHACLSGGGARPCVTESFTKSVIHVVPAVGFLSFT